MAVAGPIVMKIPSCILSLSIALLAGGALAAEDPAATVRRLSQEFSDASAKGDAAVFRRLLHKDVVFMNEGGQLATKDEIVASARPAAAGVTNDLVQDDFHVVFVGNVAVTSFTDHSTVHFFGQVIRPDFRSTEVWAKMGAGWQMISSQTVALLVDPPAVAVAPKLLDDYVGTYAADPSFVIRIRRDGDALVSSTNGAAEAPLLGESADVFFTAGQARVRRIFERDASGAVTGFRSRREGMDLVFRRQTAG